MKTRVITLLLCIITAFMALQAKTKVYILPLEEEIDARAWQHTSRCCDEATENGADLFVVRMNTYGGALDAADSIRSALIRLPIPTVAFIDHNAASAGALIALACDSIFMTPGSSIGAATVVDQSGTPMPDKYQAYMSSIMRSTAERHGKVTIEGTDSMRWRRDPAIAEAMVLPGMVVAFSTDEALKKGYSDGTVTSIDDMFDQLNIDDADPTVFVPTVTDDIIGFLSNAAIRAFLIMLIVGGIFMEMHSPGLGVAAAVALVATFLYLLPMLIVGTLQPWIVILLIVGFVLLILEIFVIPGFGICGIAGLIAIGIALFGAIIPPVEQTGGSISLASIAGPICTVSIGIVGAVAIVAWLTSRHGPKAVRRHTELMLSQDVDKGYIGVDMSPASLVGSHAHALTDLHPSGKISIDNKTYDAVSTGEFITAGTKLRVTKYENAQLYVEPTTQYEQ